MHTKANTSKQCCKEAWHGLNIMFTGSLVYLDESLFAGFKTETHTATIHMDMYIHGI